MAAEFFLIQDVQVAREFEILFNDDGFYAKDSSRRGILMNKKISIYGFAFVSDVERERCE